VLAGTGSHATSQNPLIVRTNQQEDKIVTLNKLATSISSRHEFGVYSAGRLTHRVEVLAGNVAIAKDKLARVIGDYEQACLLTVDSGGDQS
jgi:hypothetical protein